MPTSIKHLSLPIIITICFFARIDSFYAAGSCGIDQLDTSIMGSARGFTRLNGNTGTNESNYGLTTGSGQWALEFSYGTVWGMANCNTTAGVNMGDVNNNLQTESSGQYCWCQATGFTASGNSYTSGPSCTTTASSSWVFVIGRISTTAYCTSSCASDCAQIFQTEDDVRIALFGVAGYVPPTVSLNWYDGNTQMSGGPSSCTVGGTFLPPTPTARPGYIFTGWKIKPKELCGIPSLDTSIKSTDRNTFASQNDSTGSYGPTSYNTSNYGITTDNTWAKEFSYGTVWGRCMCSTTSGDTHNSTWPSNSQSDWLKTPSDTKGQYCWCQATGFTASGNDYTTGPACTTTASDLWVYAYDFEDADTCAAICAYSHASRQLPYSASSRAALYGAVGQ